MLKRKIKGAWRSLTVMVNAFALALIPVVQYASDHLVEFNELVGPDCYKHLALALLVLNIVLRFKTNSGLEDKAK